MSTVQGVLNADAGKEFVKWVGSLPVESIVDVFGRVVTPAVEITGATQQVEIHIAKLHCVSKAAPGKRSFVSHAERVCV